MLRDDIMLDGEALQLYRAGGGRGRAVQSTAIPALASESVQLADEPLVLDTFHLGMGYSQRLIPGTYSYGENVDCRWPRLVLPGPRMNAVTLTGATDHVRCAFEDGTDLYIGAGRYVYKLAGGVGAPSQDRDLGGGISAYSAVRFAGKGYVGTADASGVPDLLHQLDGSTWNSASDVKRKHLCTVFWEQDTRLIGQDGLSTISHVVANPLAIGDWAGSIPIGESSYSINRLIPNVDHVYVAKRNGLHDLDGTTGASPNLTPQVGLLDDPLNGVAGVAMNGALYMDHRKGLLRVQVTGLTDGSTFNVQPGYGLPNEGPIRGIVTALTVDGGWLVAAIWNGTDTYICYGRDRHDDEQAAGPSPMLWHGGLIKLAGQQCFLLHLSGLDTLPRLWVGAGSADDGYGVQYCLLPRTEHPLQDSEYRFADSYSLFIAGQDWDHVATPKNLLQIDVEGDNLGLGASLTVFTNVEGGVYQQYGVANTSPQSTLKPADEIIGRRIGLRLDGSGSPTAGAVERGLLLRAAARVQTREIRTYQCLLAEMGNDRFHGRQGRDPGRVWDHLKRLEVGSQVALRDELGDTLQVLVHAPVQRQEAEQVESGAGQERTARPVQLVTIQVSVLQRLGTTFRWEDGTHYDSGAVWT